MHIWPYNWKWVTADSLTEKLPNAKANTRLYMDEHLAVAKKLNKPIVLEEFGFPRDGFRFDKASATTARDSYYRFVFELIQQHALAKEALAGCNFWAWGGFANPSTKHIYWERGDDYTGDPAQEEQGLNSVFATDKSTLRMIKTANKKLRKAGGK